MVTLLLGVPLVAVAGPATPSSAAAARPNVLTIMLDDANLDYHEVNWREAMPRAAQFFGNGGREYTRAHSAIPSCCPSRATFFTGTYTQNNGVAGQAEGGDMNPTGMLQAYLGRAGYRTMLAGKYLNVWTEPPLGFDDYTSIVRVNAYDDYTIIERGVERPGTAFLTTYTGERARAMLRATEADDARPWHLNLSLNAPHMHGAMEDPDHPPVSIPGQCHFPREADRTDKPPFVRAIDITSAAANWVCGRSLQALYGADRQIGQTLDELRRLGELANTVVLLTSDNGIQVGSQNLARKWVAYDPSVRVPLLLKGPGVPAGRDSRLVALVDVLPTVLDLLDVPARTDLRPLDGVSLLSTYRRPYLLLQYHQDKHTDLSDLVPTWSALTYPNGAKYVRSTTHGSPLVTTWREYYAADAVDPREAHNLLPGGRPNTVQGNGLPYTPRLDGLLGSQLRCSGHVTRGGTCR